MVRKPNTTKVEPGTPKDKAINRPVTEKNKAVAVKNTVVSIPQDIDLSVGVQMAGSEHIELQDQAFPFLKVCQGLTPEKVSENFVGLKDGQLFNTATCAIYDEVLFVPVFYQRTFIKWRARNQGGGFVEDLGLEAGKKVLTRCTKRLPDSVVATQLTENGNLFELIETAYWAGFIIDPTNEQDSERAIFAMSSTFLTPSRNWNTQIMSFRIPGAASYIRYARPFRIRTEATRNVKGAWYIPSIAPYKPDDWRETDGPFYTWMLPNGLEIWKACDALAFELIRSGLRPTVPDSEIVPPDPNETPVTDDTDTAY
jgi:hypothetical protein